MQQRGEGGHTETADDGVANLMPIKGTYSAFACRSLPSWNVDFIHSSFPGLLSLRPCLTKKML
jgi:hypothetical protein